MARNNDLTSEANLGYANPTGAAPFLATSNCWYAWHIGRWLNQTHRTAPRDVRPSQGPSFGVAHGARSSPPRWRGDNLKEDHSMTTMIISNGSKWAGEEPDSIDTLLAVLGTHALDRTFEAYGNFVFPDDLRPGITWFFGNFANLSHVFNIETDDQGVIDRLTAAIRTNQQRPDYLAQTAAA